MVNFQGHLLLYGINSVAAGVWRKNERPVGVDWNERIIQVHGGGWNYISRSVGTSPGNFKISLFPLLSLSQM